MEAATNANVASLRVPKRARECGWPLCDASGACVTAEASKREQNPTGSEWVLSSDDQRPAGNLENPNCVLSEPTTAGAIIHSLLNLSPSVCMVLCVHASVPGPVCVCVSARPSLLESPQSLRELWKINTLRQLCLFIHLITHYHCITVPLISHHRAQIDTFVLLYHTRVWCNQLNLHLTPDTCTKWTLNTNTGASTTLQYEKEESKCTACWYEWDSVRVWRLLDRLTASSGSGRRAGTEHANNGSAVKRRGWEPRDHLPTRASHRHKLQSSMRGPTRYIMSVQNVEILPCETVGMRACVPTRVHAFVYSDCGGGCGGWLPVWDSEQRAGGLGMEQRICIDCFCASELFSRCQSCLHQLRGKLQHLHREAFSFLSIFFSSKCIYLILFYFAMGDFSTSLCVKNSLAAFNLLSDELIGRIYCERKLYCKCVQDSTVWFYCLETGCVHICVSISKYSMRFPICF